MADGKNNRFYWLVEESSWYLKSPFHLKMMHEVCGWSLFTWWSIWPSSTSPSFLIYQAFNQFPCPRVRCLTEKQFTEKGWQKLKIRQVIMFSCMHAYHFSELTVWPVHKCNRVSSAAERAAHDQTSHTSRARSSEMSQSLLTFFIRDCSLLVRQRKEESNPQTVWSNMICNWSVPGENKTKEKNDLLSLLCCVVHNNQQQVMSSPQKFQIAFL